MTCVDNQYLLVLLSCQVHEPWERDHSVQANIWQVLLSADVCQIKLTRGKSMTVIHVALCSTLNYDWRI